MNKDLAFALCDILEDNALPPVSHQDLVRNNLRYTTGDLNLETLANLVATFRRSLAGDFQDAAAALAGWLDLANEEIDGARDEAAWVSMTDKAQATIDTFHAMDDQDVSSTSVQPYMDHKTAIQQLENAVKIWRARISKE